MPFRAAMLSKISAANAAKPVFNPVNEATVDECNRVENQSAVTDSSPKA